MSSLGLVLLALSMMVLMPLRSVAADAAVPWQYGFQDPASPNMAGIVDLHHDIMFFLTAIVVAVLILLMRCLYHFSGPNAGAPDRTTHGTFLEVVWTVLPSLVLISIALPSFALLYSMDEVVDPALTLKVVGHQWYWTYEYSDHATDTDSSLVYDSYLVAEDDLVAGDYRLLETDNRVILPVGAHIRVLLTSADVIHCWAVPSLAIKLDAVPGRLNQMSLFIDRIGVFYGQCSEICGMNHGFMPIVVEGVQDTHYVNWVARSMEAMALGAVVSAGKSASRSFGTAAVAPSALPSMAHPYHLVDPSPWPAFASLGALCATIGGVCTMQGFVEGSTLMQLGFAIIFYTMYVWWRDVIRESTFQGLHTMTVQAGLRWGFILFVVSEIMFFVGFFWAFFHSALSPSVEIGAVWPPLGVDAFDPWALPFLNTLILLTSGAAVTWAHQALVVGDHENMQDGLAYCLILAAAFTIFQVLEYIEAPFSISDSVYGACFFVATGFHGLHVAIGGLFLGVAQLRDADGHLTQRHHLGFESAILYFHIVDLIWLFLFLCIYYWGA
jgi:cytochrome c oxidase subunit 3